MILLNKCVNYQLVYNSWDRNLFRLSLTIGANYRCLIKVIINTLLTFKTLNIWTQQVFMSLCELWNITHLFSPVIQVMHDGMTSGLHCPVNIRAPGWAWSLMHVHSWHAFYMHICQRCTSQHLATLCFYTPCVAVFTHTLTQRTETQQCELRWTQKWSRCGYSWSMTHVRACMEFPTININIFSLMLIYGKTFS